MCSCFCCCGCFSAVELELSPNYATQRWQRPACADPDPDPVPVPDPYQTRAETQLYCPVALWGPISIYISCSSPGRGQQTLFEILFMLDFCASMTFELPCLWLPVFTHTHTLFYTLYICVCMLFFLAMPQAKHRHICCLKLQADAVLYWDFFLSIYTMSRTGRLCQHLFSK